MWKGLISSRFFVFLFLQTLIKIINGTNPYSPKCSLLFVVSEEHASFSK